MADEMVSLISQEHAHPRAFRGARQTSIAAFFVLGRSPRDGEITIQTSPRRLEK